MQLSLFWLFPLVAHGCLNYSLDIYVDSEDGMEVNINIDDNGYDTCKLNQLFLDKIPSSFNVNCDSGYSLKVSFPSGSSILDSGLNYDYHTPHGNEGFTGGNPVKDCPTACGADCSKCVHFGDSGKEFCT
jgi:hypothetical protein